MSPDRILSQAAAILRSDPGLLDEFLDRVLYSGRLHAGDTDLIHKIHNELMRYDLMDKLPVWTAWIRFRQVFPPDRLAGIYGTRLRALAGGAAAGILVASGRMRGVGYGLGVEAVRDQAQAFVDMGYNELNLGNDEQAEGLFQEAVDLLNENLPNTAIVVKKALIE